MSNFEVLTKSSAKPESVMLLGEVEKKYGFIPNLMGVLAESPVTLKAYLTLSDLVTNSTFTPEEQQAILLAVSVENNCDYCVAAHSMVSAKMVGMSADRLSALRDGKELDNKKINELVRFTRLIVSERGFVSKEAVDRFLEAGYTRQQALEVILGVAMKTLSNYTNHLAETPVDQPFSEFRWSRK